MAEKSPRGRYILTSCCGSREYAPHPYGPNWTPAPFPPRVGEAFPVRWDTIRDLFLRQPRGTYVHITAATDGLTGWMDTKIGSYFTLALLHVLAEPLKSGVQGLDRWKTFFDKLERETNRATWEGLRQTQIPELVEFGITPTGNSPPGSV
jgi:hypothetical protein